MFKKLAALIFAGGIVATIISPIAAAPILIKTAFTHSYIMDQVANAVNRIALEYPEVRGTVVKAKAVMPGVYAFAENQSITFNVLYTDNQRLFEAMVHSDVEGHFHPPLGRCTPAELLAYHESAHIIDQARDKAPRRALIAAYGSGKSLRGVLSGYSFGEFSLAPGEALAEAFASAKCNGGNSTEQKIAALLE